MQKTRIWQKELTCPDGIMKRRGKNPSKSKGIGIGIRSLIPSIMFPAGTSSTSSTAAFVSTMPRGQTAPTGNILDPAFMPKPSAVVASDYTASTTAGTESSIVSDLSSDDSDLILLNGKSLRQTLVSLWTLKTTYPFEAIDNQINSHTSQPLCGSFWYRTWTQLIQTS